MGDELDVELEKLHRQIQDLQRQNRILKLESEISMFNRELGDYSGLHNASTPMTRKSGPSLQPDKMLDLPAGRPEGASNADQMFDELSFQDEPDRHVTHRKSKVGSSSEMKKVMMKPATFDGSVAWVDYKAHFEACAELNGWSKEQKGLYLSVSLRGQAQGVFGNLGSGKPAYDDLVTALEERFAPPNQTELYRVQLRERRQKASESMAELGQDIRRLTNLAYPKAPSDVRETLAKEQFVDSLVNSEMRLKIKQARPIDLNDAVRHAVELEAFYRAESKFTGQSFINAAVSSDSSGNKEWDEKFTALQNTVAEMSKMMKKLMYQQQRNVPGQQERRTFDHYRGQGRKPPNTHPKDNNRPARRCFNCNSDKHLLRDCPKPKDQNKAQKDEKEAGEKENVCLSSTNLAGLFVQASLGGRSTECLIDTGATLTLLSLKVWESIKISETLEKFDKEIISASGNVLATKGKARVCFDIYDSPCTMDVVIAEMDVDVILGLDFMLKHKVVVDVLGLTININGKSYPLNKVGKMGCFRVIVKDRIAVPCRSEVILSGELVGWDQGNTPGIVESSNGFLGSNRGFVARTLVKAADKVPIRYANLTNETQILYPGTNIADFSPVQVIKTVQNPKPKPPRNLPSHMTAI
ncbi:MAG: retroviral-like aspartic protease family protein [Candidatus Thiodiazotropha endolucinida]|nr:retroviral-like aspartic protease family protein [Candidatus Thiodiazotropha taylori]MCW4343276.1 retroviral-like aspartic protease family protein [Candidatus Thiodiazotropha endolucinida]